MCFIVKCHHGMVKRSITEVFAWTAVGFGPMTNSEIHRAKGLRLRSFAASRLRLVLFLWYGKYPHSCEWSHKLEHPVEHSTSRRHQSPWLCELRCRFSGSWHEVWFPSNKLKWWILFSPICKLTKKKKRCQNNWKSSLLWPLFELEGIVRNFWWVEFDDMTWRGLGCMSKCLLKVWSESTEIAPAG